MKRKILYSSIIIGMMSAFVLFSPAKLKTTTTQPAPLKETMQDCCKKKLDTDSGGVPDFESLPGKFFSTVLIN